MVHLLLVGIDRDWARTACGLWLGELPEEDTYWLARPGCEMPGPVECPMCRSGEEHPIRSDTPFLFRAIVVYDSPRDFPGEVVAREQFAARGQVIPGELVSRAPDLATCRQQINERFPGLYRMPRAAADQKQIVEVWI
jgi:hypothetical protein